MKINQLVLAVSVVFAAPAFAADEAVSPAANPEQQAEAPATPAATGTIARSTFTTAVENREPVDSISKLGADRNKIYYFTELKDMGGQQVTHRWEYNGKVMAEVPFQVGGSRWRVYSSKLLDNDWKGEWKVSVIDTNGSTLSVNTFTYTGESASGEMQLAPATASPEANEMKAMPAETTAQ